MFLKIALFSAIVVFLFFEMTRIFVLKTYPVGPNVNILIKPTVLCEKQDGFYSLENNTLDAVFIGSSNIHCNINPNVIWHEYGITTYDFSSDQQDIGTSYYYLQQVFKSQSPKVVMIDVLSDGSTVEIPELSAHFAFDHMKNDISKIKGIWNRTRNKRLEMYIPFITYHERWKELSKEDFVYAPNMNNILKGSFIYMLVTKMEEPVLPEQVVYSELADMTVMWLEKIVDLCEKNNCQCVFIKTPFAFYEDGMFSYFDAISRYCDDNSLPFLYMNKLVSEIGIDFDTDYSDGMHMNWNGQLKLSQYIGRYLSENYDFEDKRSKAKYSSWDEDYNKMRYYIDNFWDLYNNIE